MWFPKQDLLIHTTPANAFLVCRWNEFFDRFTPDSYRARVCHLPILVTEVAEVSRLGLKDDALHKHLIHLKQECRARVDEDAKFFKLSLPTELTLLQQISAESTPPEQTAKKTEALLRLDFRQRYERAAVDSGQVEIARALNNHPCHKANADRWLGLWATIAMHRSYLRSGSFGLRDDNTLANRLETNLELIARDLTQSPRQYVCLVAIHAKPEPRDPAAAIPSASVKRLKEAANKAGIKLAPHGWLPSETLINDELLLTASEEGLGPHDALDKFVRKLRPLINLVGFYRGASPAHPIKRGWAGVERKRLTEYDVSPLTSWELQPRKNAVRLAANSFEITRSGRSCAVLANALELHHMAMSSPDLRVRFITLWSALECLASIATGASVIARVMNLVVPIITWRRMEKAVRYLALNLKHWNEDTRKTPIAPKALPNSSMDEVPGEDVLLAVSRPKNHPEIVELLGAVAAQPLLLWRVNCAWNVFHNPKVLANDLCCSRERLTWHLGRIYRVRNRLLRAGEDPSLIYPLLENLQYYLSATISRLLHGMSLYRDASVERVADNWRMLAERVEQKLLNAPSELTVSDILASPRILRDQRPWGR